VSIIIYTGEISRYLEEKYSGGLKGRKFGI